MPIRLYNSLTRSVQSFEPADPQKVEMFVCGPTVYDFIHLGNARTFTVFDVVAKWLRHRGFTVAYLQNITDIDDKIIRAARANNKDPLALAQRFTDAFLEDMQALGNDAVSRYVRATEHIPQVIAQVKTLRDTGHAYRIEQDGWYFDLSTFPDYGKLSGRTELQDDDAVSRVDENPDKRNPGDFALWKLAKPGEPAWDFETGAYRGITGAGVSAEALAKAGRPGWHIEDTAMTEHHFGPQYDLHGGGLDLTFPHHEAEIAQQESASGLTPFVRHWMHAGFLELKDTKMSKSVGNIVSLRDALAERSAAAVRLFLLGAHYRGPLTLSEQTLAAAEAGAQRIGEFAVKLNADLPETGDTTVAEKIAEARMAFETAMDDDLNTPEAIGAVFSLIRQINPALNERNISATDGATLGEFLQVVTHTLGIISTEPLQIPDEVSTLIRERQTARDAKDFAKADELRNRITETGWSVDDTPYGPLIKKK